MAPRGCPAPAALCAAAVTLLLARARRSRDPGGPGDHTTTPGSFDPFRPLHTDASCHVSHLNKRLGEGRRWRERGELAANQGMDRERECFCVYGSVYGSKKRKDSLISKKKDAIR